MKAFNSRSPHYARLCATGMALALAAGAHAQARVDVTNLVTNDPLAHPGQISDAGLVNAWGFSYSATSPFWTSSNGTDTATLYNVNPATQATSNVGWTIPRHTIRRLPVGPERARRRKAPYITNRVRAARTLGTSQS